MTLLNPPHYQRQRFLLVLLELAGGRLSKMDLQKLLFLSQQGATCPYYDFVPYRYGCYSFQAQADLELLASRGWLRTMGKDVQLLEPSAASMASDALVQARRFANKYKDYRGAKLVRYVYTHYPYYAIHSKIAKEILDTPAYEAVVHTGKQLQSNTEQLFTIGYEGLSVERYINQLIGHDVHLLCDVRSNPLSRKFGFSKGMLRQWLPTVGIEYLHIPELGIRSEHRTHLETESDYVQLFQTYRKSLPQKKASLERLNGLLDQHQRIALTCFEKRPESCHRHCVSEYMEGVRGIQAVHL